jgi:hypothetical protein
LVLKCAAPLYLNPLPVFAGAGASCQGPFELIHRAEPQFSEIDDVVALGSEPAPADAAGARRPRKLSG